MSLLPMLNKNTSGVSPALRLAFSLSTTAPWPAMDPFGNATCAVCGASREGVTPVTDIVEDAHQVNFGTEDLDVLREAISRIVSVQ